MAVHLRNLLHGLDPEHQVLILRMRLVPFVDATAAAALRDVIDTCVADGRILILSGVTQRCRDDLHRHGLIQRIGEDRIAPDIQTALGLATTLLAPTSPGQEAIGAVAR
jgi:SulP family sulfate permease